MSFWNANSDLDWYDETRGPDEAELEARERERRAEAGEGDDDEEESPHDCADSGGEECPGCIRCYQQTGRTVCAYVCTHARYGLASGWLRRAQTEDRHDA